MTTRIIEGSEAKTLEAKVKWNLLSPFLKQFGSGCMAYSTLQPEMEYFIDEDKGYIAYSTIRHPLAPFGRRIVLSDPIVNPKDLPAMIKEFLKRGKHATFLQIREKTAKTLDELGYEVNKMGIEYDIDLPSFDLKGKTKAQLRHWINKAKKEKVEVEDKPIEEMDWEEVKKVSEDWLERKGGEEARILTRPLAARNEPDVRYFWGKQNGHVKGVIVFDPIYKDGKVIGYYHDLVRIVKDAPHGTSDFMTVEAIEKFKKEGINWVSLGMSPLCELDDKELNYNKTLGRFFRFMYDKCNYVYPFQGNHFHKSKYHAPFQSIYFSSSRKNTPREVAVVLRALNLPLFPQFSQLFRKGKNQATDKNDCASSE